jgi:type II secretory pathway component GspD/PulD (secretin)
MIDERSGIPWLKDVPGLRYLFSREVRREHKSHIIVTITPTSALNERP